MQAIDCWLADVQGRDMSQEMFATLAQELPACVTWVATRWCNLDCRHCVYPLEKLPPEKTGAINKVVLNLVQQLPSGGRFLHAGRVLLPGQIPTLEAIRQQRPDISIGLIDNGTAPTVLRRSNIKLDYWDVSIDGSESSHDKQRAHPGAFRRTLEAVTQRDKVLVAGGRLSALMCITCINYQDVASVANLTLNDECFDQLYLSFFSPVQHRDNLSVNPDQFRETWRQIEDACSRYTTGWVKLPIYRLEDLATLRDFLGVKRFAEAFDKALVLPETGAIEFQLGVVTVEFAPLSIWKETAALIDADNASRVALSAKYTLRELQNGRSEDGADVSNYTVKSAVGTDASLKALYRDRVRHWVETFGPGILEAEREFFRALT